jgi:predicted hydrolase (HD superfamily)
VSRDKIMSCESLGLTRNELFALALEALQPLSDELGM